MTKAMRDTPTEAMRNAGADALRQAGQVGLSPEGAAVQIYTAMQAARSEIPEDTK